MRERMSQAATRSARAALAFGAEKLANSELVMGLVYDLSNESNFAGLSEHEEMLSDEVRVSAYHRAIGRYVAPGDVVLDLGTGTGLLAFMASRAGAAKVYAVEHSDFIEVAREIARHNQITNIEFVQANSREFTAPEPVDVVLHEQMGDELFNENMLENLLDARARLLRPGGRILPARFRLFVEPVSFNEAMRVRRFWNIELPDGIAPADYYLTLRGVDANGLPGFRSVARLGLVEVDETVAPVEVSVSREGQDFLVEVIDPSPDAAGFEVQVSTSESFEDPLSVDVAQTGRAVLRVDTDTLYARARTLIDPRTVAPFGPIASGS